MINTDRNRVAKRLLVNTPKPKAQSREYFIRLAREHANIGGWYDESILETIGRAINANRSCR